MTNPPIAAAVPSSVAAAGEHDMPLAAFVDNEWLLLQAAAMPPEIENAAADCDHFDSLPFNTEMDSNNDSNALADFYECQTWEEEQGG